MSSTTFTAKQLEESLSKVQSIDRDFPELPVRFFGPYQELWSQETFPIVFKRVGDAENVNVSFKEFVGGDEAGPMSIIIQVGYGDNARYFEKDGFYDSWDNGNDDYQWDGVFKEVELKEVTVKQWVSKK